jgi:hypothetical protein
MKAYNSVLWMLPVYNNINELRLIIWAAELKRIGKNKENIQNFGV